MLVSAEDVPVCLYYVTAYSNKEEITEQAEEEEEEEEQKSNTFRFSSVSRRPSIR